ncbi:phosphotransferase [Sphingomonas profundi]|uniref:phosphotransferase n=1 Tax=Alterirhizorhabdus profundi TaxID=2681549 RepID=UPI0018D0B613|nr:phosphotransferase [Sphingomonas profundi]
MSVALNAEPNSAEAITAAFRSEQHDEQVTRADQVPKSYGSITPAWLTDVLCGDAPGARVESHRFDERDDGSSNRRRIFLTYNDAGQVASLPSTVFCKAAEALENRLVLSLSGAAQIEADFYNLVRGRLDIEAPVGLYAQFDPETYASLIMMRDLGSSVRFCDDRTHMDFDHVASQMRTLAGLHSRFYESPELGGSTLPFRTWPDWWRNMMTVSPDFASSCDVAFGQAEPLMPERLFRRRAEIWPATDASVERHRALPRTLIHCDVHLKNWYIAADKRMGLSDFQIVSVGHWSRDVIYTMTTALTIEDRRRWEKDLVRYYLDQMAERGVPRTSEDEAWAALRQQLMTALAFWTITLVPAEGMPAMQPERTTHEFLRRLLAAIDDHDVLDSF